MNQVGLALGSNVGDRKDFLEKAIQHLKEDLLEEAKVSSFYETEPWGETDQPAFLNAVIIGKTDWTPSAILNYTGILEKQLGRTPSRKWGPREIDIDLLFFNEQVIQAFNLQVPHPGMAERTFVLEPLAEICPEWIHPIYKVNVAELLQRLRTSPTK